MNDRSLHSVIDKILTAGEQWPEIDAVAKRFVFDDAHQIREGLYELVECAGVDVQDGSANSIITVLEVAKPDLIHFAHAVANGVVPHMPLAA